MTDEIINLGALLEKSSDADLLREMIGFTAQRLMELEVEGLTGAAHGERNADRINQRNAIATGHGRRARAQSNCASPSCARAATFRPSWSRAGCPRRRSLRWCRKLTCTAYRPAQSTIWSRPWA
jgi:hypothetical protein